MNIVMIGSGYVGLVSGVCFADIGHHVTCVDKNEGKIELLKQGQVPFYERGLEKLLSKNIENGRMHFATDPAKCVRDADAVFICVGTPPRGVEGHADIGYVETAAKETARAMRGFTVVVNKSTVPVGTGERVEEIIRAEYSGDFDVVSNPEFLREGSAIKDFKNPDRIIVGTTHEKARQVMADIYAPLLKGLVRKTPLMFTDRPTAEITKYAANAFLATKITFINEMADLCEAAGAHVGDVAKGIGLDRRIGKKFLRAGPGYGGSCFPKDTKAVAHTARQFGAPLDIVETVIKVNQCRKEQMIDKIIHACGGDVRGKRLCILGLTFKPNTDDMREAPSLTILPALKKLGAHIIAYDPEGREQAEALMPQLEYASSANDAITTADAVIVLTEWKEFKKLDLLEMKQGMKGDVLVDLRNIYEPDHMVALGFHYTSIGRPVVQGRAESLRDETNAHVA